MRRRGWRAFARNWKRREMTVLVPVLLPIEGESIVSWCSRLGSFHAGLTASEWLRMMQISRQSVIDATTECVDRLASLTGISPERIGATGVMRKSDRTFLHRAEEFGMRFALLTNTTYCPLCLIEDAEPGSPSAGRGVGRINWVFSPVRTCPTHGILLTRRPNKGFHERFQDMTRVAPDIAELQRQAAAAERRPLSPLQRYVEGRFAGDLAFEWPDGQPVDQVAKACEMLGACVAFGAHADLDQLSLSQWDEAGAVGFEAAAQGSEGVRRALENIEAASRDIRSKGGPQAFFGRPYQWLQFNKTQREPGPIREIVREHILRTMQVEPGTNLFGAVVAQRWRHSVQSLAAGTGIHPRTLNRALVRTGILVDGDEGRLDATMGFDAAAGEALAQRIRSSISIRKIPDYLNCNRTQAEMLVRQGVIPQLAPGLGREGGVLTNVAVADLDRFLARFRSAGRPVAQAGAGMADVIAAAEPARQAVADIVQLVLDGKLSRVEVLAAELRFRPVLVDPEEVREVAKMRDGEIGLSADEVAARPGVFPSGIPHLRETLDRDRRPFLRAQELVNARGTVRYRFDEEEVARFQTEHVTLTVLAKERGMSAKALSRSLNAAGIEPIMRRELLSAAIFRRADL